MTLTPLTVYNTPGIIENQRNPDYCRESDLSDMRVKEAGKEGGAASAAASSQGRGGGKQKH